MLSLRHIERTVKFVLWGMSGAVEKSYIEVLAFTNPPM